MEGKNEVGSASTRSFHDVAGVKWQVYERVRVEQGIAVTILMFESNASFRCVRLFPAEWRAMDDAGLRQLSWDR